MKKPLFTGCPRTGNTGPAIDALSQALRINPSLVRLRNLLAEAYLVAGKRDRGIDEFRRSLATQPDQPQVRERLLALGA